MLPARGAKLCYQCHDSKTAGMKFPHPPVADGDCTSCHDPHAGPGRGMTVAAGADLCEMCHDSKRAGKKNLHPPVAEGDCTACHGPHGGKARNLLPASGDLLCAECHDVAEKAAALPVKHDGLEGGCATCHDAHGTGERKLLTGKGGAVCFQCHDTIEAQIKAAKSQHAPVAEGDCGACHNPHGSVHRAILREAFPEDFYAGYDERAYALCFGCHDSLLAKYERTSEATGFRNGDRSLHYLHVNRPVKGRTCKSCHGVHGADQPRLIQSRVPHFGSWEIPIQYTPTKNGATCLVGCHKPKTYDRVRPVKYK